jgi:hypothetical protein
MCTPRTRAGGGAAKQRRQMTTRPYRCRRWQETTNRSSQMVNRSDRLHPIGMAGPTQGFGRSKAHDYRIMGAGADSSSRRKVFMGQFRRMATIPSQQLPRPILSFPSSFSDNEQHSSRPLIPPRVLSGALSVFIVGHCPVPGVFPPPPWSAEAIRRCQDNGGGWKGRLPHALTAAIMISSLQQTIPKAADDDDGGGGGRNRGDDTAGGDGKEQKGGAGQIHFL